MGSRYQLEGENTTKCIVEFMMLGGGGDLSLGRERGGKAQGAPTYDA